MPVTWNKVSEAKKSKEADMISDSENLDVMVVSDHFESENSEFGFLVRRPSYDDLIDHNSNSHSNSRDNEIRWFTGNGQNTPEIDSGSELKRVSG